LATPTGDKSILGNLAAAAPPTISASILGSSKNLNPAQQAMAEVRAAGHTDWRVTPWLLERDPETREFWSDPAPGCGVPRRHRKQGDRAPAGHRC